MNPRFERFVRKAGIENESLCVAVDAILLGRFDADLGQGVYKQRIARKGEGKSGGFRTIVVVRSSGYAFFIYGFRKSDAANVSSGELQQLKKLASVLLEMTSELLDRELNAGYLIEVKCDGEALP